MTINDLQNFIAEVNVRALIGLGLILNAFLLSLIVFKKSNRSKR